MRGGTRAIGRARAFEKIVGFKLDAIGRAAATRAIEANLDGQIQQQGQIRLKTLRRPALKLDDAFDRLRAPAALVRITGISEAIAKHPLPGGQGRRNFFVHVLRARGEHQQQFGWRGDATVQLGIEQHLANGLPSWRTARFARGDDVVATGHEPGAHGLEHRAFAGTFAAFKRDQFSARCRHCACVCRFN